MSGLRVRALDEGELDGAEEILVGATPAGEARASLVRLGGLDDKSLQLGDGWRIPRRQEAGGPAWRR